MSDNQQNQDLKAELLDKLITFVTAGFSFVAALAWNEAIQALFRKFFGPTSALPAMFAYAILITVIAVLVTSKLTSLVRHFKR